MTDSVEDIAVAEDEKSSKKGDGAIVKVVARALWTPQWRAANPEGTPEARRAAWQEARGEETKKARKLIKSLENSGVTLTMVAKERKGKKAQSGDDDDLDLND